MSGCPDGQVVWLTGQEVKTDEQVVYLGGLVFFWMGKWLIQMEEWFVWVDGWFV
mgnify:CR=1 FL=1